eukprot:2714187-Karenia_brevis.AAC.1
MRATGLWGRHTYIHGCMVKEHSSNSWGANPPYVGSKANQAKGSSYSGKGPAAGIGQPYVICHQ